MNSRTYFILVIFAFYFLYLRQPCTGAITAVAPFIGDFSESFESFPNGSIPGTAVNLSGPATILSGNGTLTGINNSANIEPAFIWNSNGGFSLGLNGTAIPFDGVKGLAAQSATSTFDDNVLRFAFASPVKDFGGYWVHARTSTHGGPVSLTFLDTANTPIGTDSFVYNSSLAGASEWFGWNSTIPIGAVEFTGFFAAVDGVQINLIPEPRTHLMIIVGTLSVAIRRNLLQLI